jgi:hypothetical protein
MTQWWHNYMLLYMYKLNDERTKINDW